MSRKMWLWILSVAFLILYGGAEKLYQHLPYRFAGTIEVPMTVLLKPSDESGKLEVVEPTREKTFGAVSLLLYSGKIYPQEYYISRDNTLKVQEISFGQSTGHALSSSFNGYIRENEIILSGVEAPGGSTTLISFISKNRGHDPVTLSLTYVESRGIKIGKAILTSQGELFVWIGLFFVLGSGIGYILGARLEIFLFEQQVVTADEHQINQQGSSKE